MPADVEVEAFGAASTEELKGLAQVLGEFDLNASSVRAGATRAEPVTTIILVCVISAFFAAIARRAGDDTYSGLKRFVRRLSGRGKRGREPEPALPRIERIIIRSPTGLTVQIGLDVSDGALRALAERELTDEDQGTLHYVPDREEWELDPPD
jgi:hypothetical protein